ncbi:MAG: ParB N-terminal domain-containing protein, partial [Desulfobacteraceae bacterium]
MNKKKTVKVEDIVIDRSIYPRGGIDEKRISLFVENMRDGFKFDPIHLQEHPDKPGKYRILDGVIRFMAYRETGETEVAAEIIELNGEDPLLYAAKQTLGPKQLSEEETRNTARRAYLRQQGLEI